MELNISFVASPNLRFNDLNASNLIWNIVGPTFGSFDKAPIRLNGKIFKNMNGLSGLSDFYKNEILGQAYKILGSVEFLGNPIGLAASLGTGLTDFFYKPAQGLVQGPEKFGEGLADGSISLITNTIGGLFGSASKVTGSLGQGVAVLTMDDDFRAQRESKKGHTPEHVVDGISTGVKSFGKGLFGGITGLVVSPIKGAQKDGIEGFFTGTAKGVVGLVAKPVSGAVDMVSSTLEGIGNTADYLLNEDKKVKRVRPQRYINQNKPLEIYDRRKAKDQERRNEKNEDFDLW